MKVLLPFGWGIGFKGGYYYNKKPHYWPGTYKYGSLTRFLTKSSTNTQKFLEKYFSWTWGWYFRRFVFKYEKPKEEREYLFSFEAPELVWFDEARQDWEYSLDGHKCSVFEKKDSFWVHQHDIDQVFGPYKDRLEARHVTHERLGELDFFWTLMGWPREKDVEIPKRRELIFYGDVELALKSHAKKQNIVLSSVDEAQQIVVDFLKENYSEDDYRGIEKIKISSLTRALCRELISDLQDQTTTVFICAFKDHGLEVDWLEIADIFLRIGHEGCKVFYPGLREAENELVVLCKQVMDSDPDAVEKIHSGNNKPFNFLFGKVMKETKGEYDPQRVRDALTKALAPENLVPETN